MIEHSTIEHILDTARIEDVIGDFVALKRRGADYKGLCPFHQDKNPSLSVSPAKNIYKCFSCGKAGNVITFLKEHEQMNYVEALRYLARKYGIEIEETVENEEDAAKRMHRESLLIVSDFAQKFYQEQLWSAEKSHLIGLSYFKERKFRDETIKKFGLGYAAGNNSLSKTALENGYKRDYLVEAGLAVVREDGTLADRFYNRVMFPIHSISGRVVAFGGRILVNDKNKQKYVNTRETEIYVKNRIVYGLFFAKQEITKQKKCYLVEGYTDVISMHQAGIENVVASCGTSLTSGQINMIKRFTDNLTIIYDGDEAGQNASVKGIDLILKEGMKVKIVALPPDEDPDSFAKSHTKQEIEDYITDHEEDFITYKSKKLKDVAGKDIAKRAQVINEILNTIALVQDRIERNLYADMIVEMFHLQSETVFQKIAQIRKQNRQLDEARERYNANQQTTQDDVIPDNANIEGKIEIASSILDLPEKELLYYVLKYGRYPMFTDDDYRNGRKADQVIKVSEYISNGLSEDEIVFENQLYRKIYDEYFTLPQQCSDNPEADQDVVIRHFINHPDQAVSNVMLNILYEDHPITVKVYIESMVPEDQLLGRNVPKSLLRYKLKLTELECNRITKEIEAADNGENFDIQQVLIKNLMLLNKVKNALSKEINRI